MLSATLFYTKRIIHTVGIIIIIVSGYLLLDEYTYNNSEITYVEYGKIKQVATVKQCKALSKVLLGYIASDGTINNKEYDDYMTACNTILMLQEYKKKSNSPKHRKQMT